MSSVAASQGRTFLRLFAELHPHLRTDKNLPARLQKLLAGERRFGSRDRRLYRELLYTAIRYLPWVEADFERVPENALRAIVWLAADMPATRPLKETLTADWPPLPETIAARAAHLGATASLIPEWFRTHCEAVFASPDLDVIHTRAPPWLRLQTDTPSAVFDEFSERGWQWRTSEILPDAVEFMSDADVTATDAYQRGLIEVQDLGSQLLLETVRPPESQHWLDACAGAGGKTLQLARLLGPAGKVDAHDVRRAALDELGRRAQRAGQRQIRILDAAPPPDRTYDGVLVDAPCSGSGTWRRSPHLKWCTTEADIGEAARRQREILARYARHVRPGGLLVYATCSLSHRENDDVVTAFLATHSDFAPAPLSRTFGAATSPTGLTLRPSLYNTDGFYVAGLRRAGAKRTVAFKERRIAD